MKHPRSSYCKPKSSRRPFTTLFAVLTLLHLAGCPRPQEQPDPSPLPSRPAQPLKVLVVDDAGLATAVERQWLARAEGAIEVSQTTSADLLAADRRGVPADALIYPSGLLGELVERGMVAPLPDSELNGPKFARRDIFDLVRQREIAWGKPAYAVPLGSPVFTLIYRRDIFEALGLEPPATWPHFAALAAQLADRGKLGDLAPPDAEPWKPVVEPLGEGWAAEVLLARAAGYARHRNYFSTLFDAKTMTPLIAGPPFVQALEELLATYPQGPADMLAFGPAEALREILAGRCAMCVSWPRGGEDAEAAEPTVLPLAFAELPGSQKVYDPGSQQWQPRDGSEVGRVSLLGIAGRLGSVSSAARQPQAAASLLVNLSSTEWSEQVSPSSPATTLYRDSQLALAQAWMGTGFDAAAAREYGELLRQMQRRSLWMCSPRIPGRHRYLAALDAAVQQTLRGEAKPAEALGQAAEQWQAITDELGMEKQRAAYWRSQGLEP